MQPFHTKTSFLTFPDPRKSSQNRCQNALKISFILDTLLEPQKIRFLMLKRRQDGPPKFPIFFKNRPKILALTVFGPRCLLEASKKPPRLSQEPPRATQEPPRAAQEPPKSLPRACQEASRRHTSPPEAPKSPQEAPVAAPKRSQATAHTSELQNVGGGGARPVGVFDTI